MAQEDYFLKIDGITGESQDDKHKDEIHVSSFSFGVSNAGTGGSNLGSGGCHWAQGHQAVHLRPDPHRWHDDGQRDRSPCRCWGGCSS